MKIEVVNLSEERKLLIKTIVDASIHLPRLSLYKLMHLATKGNWFINDSDLATNIMTMINAELIKKEFIPLNIVGQFVCLGCGQLTIKDREHFVPPSIIKTPNNIPTKHYIPGHYTCLQDKE